MSSACLLIEVAIVCTIFLWCKLPHASSNGRGAEKIRRTDLDVHVSSMKKVAGLLVVPRSSSHDIGEDHLAWNPCYTMVSNMIKTSNDKTRRENQIEQ